MDNKVLLKLLKSEMKPAMGCTEPATATLCGAKVYELLKAFLGNFRLSKLVVMASRDMIKNAMGVSIPSFQKKRNMFCCCTWICYRQYL